MANQVIRLYNQAIIAKVIRLSMDFVKQAVNPTKSIFTLDNSC